MPHLPLMQWDYRRPTAGDQRRQVRQTNGGARRDDLLRLRRRRAARAQGDRAQQPATATRKNERIYLGGFEIYREHDGDGARSAGARDAARHGRQAAHRPGGDAHLDSGNDPAPQQLIRYQFGNHLGSASLELDDQAQIISYEEYHPYGSTSYQAVRSQTETPKRYRYTGKERDEESGLVLPRGALLRAVAGEVDEL